jgi:hypothetical protein
MVYGPPKSGKTELVGYLGGSHKLIWIDIEKGGKTLAKLPSEIKSNIDYYRIVDTPDEPNGIDTCLRLITGAATTFCAAHGKVACGKCAADKQAKWHTLELGKLDPATHVVVFDSATQLTSSATAKTFKQFNLKMEAKFEFDHWAYQGVLLRRFYEFMQNAQFNVVVISHESALKLEDGTDKIVPSSGTENFSRNVAKYFGHIIYCDVVNMKHRQASHSTAYNKVLTGSRSDLVIPRDGSERNVLAGCFQPKPVEEKVINPTTLDKATTLITTQASTATPAQSASAALLAKLKR